MGFRRPSYLPQHQPETVKYFIGQMLEFGLKDRLLDTVSQIDDAGWKAMMCTELALSLAAVEEHVQARKAIDMAKSAINLMASNDFARKARAWTLITEAFILLDNDGEAKTAANEARTNAKAGQSAMGFVAELADLTQAYIDHDQLEEAKAFADLIPDDLRKLMADLGLGRGDGRFRSLPRRAGRPRCDYNL